MFGIRQNKKNDQPDVSAPLANLTRTMNKIEDTLAQDTAPVKPVKTHISTTMAQNVIGKGTVIDGNLTAEGDLSIEGAVRGDVSTKTRLVVGEGAIVEGNIAAHHAEIAGRVTGTVQAYGLLVIKSSGVIDGDVITKNLNVESGSTFNGRFKVGGPTTPVRKTETSTSAEAAPTTKV